MMAVVTAYPSTSTSTFDLASKPSTPTATFWIANDESSWVCVGVIAAPIEPADLEKEETEPPPLVVWPGLVNEHLHHRVWKRKPRSIKGPRGPPVPSLSNTLNLLKMARWQVAAGFFMRSGLVVSPQSGYVKGTMRAKKTKSLVAANVKRLREYKGWSQSELAQKVGIGQAAVCRIESGSHDPNGGTIDRLAAALGVSPDKLLAGPQKKSW